MYIRCLNNMPIPDHNLQYYIPELAEVKSTSLWSESLHAAAPKGPGKLIYVWSAPTAEFSLVNSAEQPLFGCKLTRFTNNCGMCTLMYPYSRCSNSAIVLQVLERFLYRVGLIGVVLASDKANGPTTEFLKKYGRGWITCGLAHNPTMLYNLEWMYKDLNRNRVEHHRYFSKWSRIQ